MEYKSNYILKIEYMHIFTYLRMKGKEKMEKYTLM